MLIKALGHHPQACGIGKLTEVCVCVGGWGVADILVLGVRKIRSGASETLSEAGFWGTVRFLPSGDVDLEGIAAFRMARGYGIGDVVSVIVDPLLEVLHFGVNGNHVGQVCFWLTNDSNRPIWPLLFVTRGARLEFRTRPVVAAPAQFQIQPAVVPTVAPASAVTAGSPLPEQTDHLRASDPLEVQARSRPVAQQHQTSLLSVVLSRNVASAAQESLAPSELLPAAEEDVGDSIVLDALPPGWEQRKFVTTVVRLPTRKLY